MISEINLSLEVVQPFETNASKSEIANLAEKTIHPILPRTPAALDPLRVTNAITYLVEKVEDIQTIERLYYSYIRHEYSDIKGIILNLKQRADGLVSHWVLSYGFEFFVRESNVELMNLLIDEFGDRIAIDAYDLHDAIDVYIMYDQEERAIWLLDHIESVKDMDEDDLEDLIDFAKEHEMATLTERLCSLNV